MERFITDKILDDPYVKETLELFKWHLIRLYEDEQDENSLYSRFWKLIHKFENLEMSHEAVWNSYLRTVEENGKLKKKYGSIP